MHNLLVDTGFWFALFNPADQYHSQATDRAEWLERANILLPWPSLYETLNTQFVKRQDRMRLFERIARQPHAIRVDDTPYRDSAYELTLRMALEGKRPISLVDMVLRLMLDSTAVRVRYMLTFNPADFSDVCRKQSVEILC